MVQKLDFFRSFLFKQIGQKNVCYDILERKNPFLGNKKKFKKSKKLRFSKAVNQWFWSKNGHFSMVFLKYNISQENVFYDILKRKNAFLGYKNKKIKKSKNWDFSKGVNPCFWSKNGLFSIFFLSNIGQENVCYDILEQKNDFLGYKHKEFEKSKN